MKLKTVTTYQIEELEVQKVGTVSLDSYGHDIDLYVSTATDGKGALIYLVDPKSDNHYATAEQSVIGVLCVDARSNSIKVTKPVLEVGR